MAREEVDIVVRGKDEASDAFHSARRGLGDLETAAGKPSGGGRGGGGASAALAGIGTAATAAAAVAVAAIGTIGVALFDISGQADTARTALQGLDDVNISGVLSDASLLSARYGTDLNETLDATRTLMDEFGLTSEEATGILIAGFDQGLNVSDDFLDSISEYSNLMADNGFTAAEFFSIMDTGMAGGVLGTDKAADALKEFGIRMREIPNELFGPQGSLIMSGMFTGDELDAMVEGFENGTVSMADAFNLIMPRLREIDNEIERNTIGTKLFGTQWEDLGMSAMLGIDTATTSMEELITAAESGRNQFGSLGEIAPRLWSEFTVALLPAADAMLAMANDIAPLLFDVMETGGAWVAQAAAGFALLVEGLTGATGEGSLFASIVATAQPILDRLGLWITNAAAWFQTSLMPALQAGGGVIASALMPRIESLSEFVGTTLMPILESFGRFIGDNLPGFINVVAPLIATLIDVGLTNFENALRMIVMVWTTLLQPAFERMSAWIGDLTGGWANLTRGAKEAQRIIGELAAKMRDLVSVKAPEWMTGGFKMPKFEMPKLPGFAGGVTNFSGGAAIVGERGPELVTLPRGSNVIPAPQTRQALAAQAPSSGGGMSLNLTVAPVINGMTVDNADRVRQVASEIAATVRNEMTREFSRAIDGLILGGGAR